MTETFGHGVVGGDQTVYSVESEALMCLTSGCHDILTTQASAPVTRENFSHPAYPEYGLPQPNTVTYTPSSSAWPMRYDSVHTAGRESYSNYPGATLSVTFTGQQVSLVADKDPYRGIAQVLIDGSLVATVDLYAATTTYQAVVFESSQLSAGSHTITVRSTGTKNPSSRYAYVTVDCFKVYTRMPDSIAPGCGDDVGCHSDKLSGHGGDFSHEATHTAGTYNGFGCDSCHLMPLTNEHARTSSKTATDSCSACHTTYAAYALDTYDFTCSWNAYGPGCHQTANNEQPHNFIDSNHDASAIVATDECRACHGDDISVIHDDSSAARSQHASLSSNGWVTDCLTCHSASSFPATKDCTDSGCHTGSGVVDMDTHPAPAHIATNNNTGVQRTGGLVCSTCHITELTSEHAKASSLTDPGNSAIACADCHAASYFPAGWMDTAGTTNTCNACHDPAGAADAGLPHEADEYNAKHDWSATNGSGGSSYNCSGALCHDVAAVDAIHTDPFNATVTNPRGSSCESCHDTPNAVPIESDCLDCHTDHGPMSAMHSPNGTPELTAANADCLACHTTLAGTSGLVYHAGMCYTCHNRLVTNKLDHYLQDNYTAKCIDCHNSTVLGTYEYQPYDPNHYDPYLVNHTADYTGLSVVTGGAVVTAKSCTSCHANSLKAEHVLTLSAGAVSCIDCHTMSAPIDAAGEVAANWTNNRCADCHGANHGGTGQAAHDLGDASCAGADCHANTNDLALVHADTDTGSATSCNVCHTSADTSLSSITSCAGAGGCHTTHDLTKHVTSASAECVDCHESADVRTVHAGGCSTCHGSATYPALPGANTAECVQCHGDEVGAHAYSPIDPDHYTGTETAHTASAQGGTYAGFACTQCHNLEMKPEHITKTSSAFATVPSTYTDKCVACHEAEVDSLGVWNDTCAPCHAVTHDAEASRHDASATSAGCGGAGCHEVTDISVIHDDSVTSNATVTDCATCHVDNTAVPAGSACATSGCHDGMSAHSHDLDVAASDYDNATVSGCTNSGAGCHGTDASANYQSYHVAVGCLSGGCHTSASQTDPAFDNPNSCQDCHTDGAYAGAVDTVGLGVAAPSGHYGEAIHTASGLASIVSAGGSTTASCSTCHDPTGTLLDGLYNQHQGLQTLGATTCADCHNYSAGVTAEITSSWTGRTCADCHNGTDMPGLEQHGATVGAATGSSTDGCVAAGCHVSDLHAIHEGDGSAPDPACTVCHDATKQGWKPTDTTCGASGACHTSGYHANMATAHTASASSACVACHENTDIATQHGAACTTCHGNATYPALPGTSAECLDCHISGLAEEPHVGSGGEYSPYDPNHYVGTEALHSVSAAQASATYDGFACTQCHSTEMKPEHITKTSSAFSTVPATHADKCVACHELDVDNFAGAWDDTCAACHATTHTSRVTKHDATGIGNADSCAGGGCHAVTDISVIHDDSVTSNSTVTDCATCHVDNTAVPTALGCDTSGCHAGMSGHTAAHDTATSSSCVQCHEYANSLDQHAPAVIGASVSGKTNDGCNICHGGNGWTDVRSGVTDPECISCHNGTLVGTHSYDPYDPDHYTPATAQHTASGTETGISNTGGKACATCHTLELDPEHAKPSTSFSLGGYADECVACHEIDVDGFAAAWNDECQACHTSATVHTAFTTAHDYDARSASNSTSCAGADCHDVTSADALHSPALPGSGDCTSCHDTNASVPTEQLCSDCHTASPHDQATAHNGSAASVPANADCVACHAPYTDLTTHTNACAGCHANATLADYLSANYTAACTDCHTPGVLGGTYDPHDPNHYVADPTHTALVGSDTVSTGGSVIATKACTACHSTGLKAEHAFTLSAGSVTCIDCHTDTTLGSSTVVAANWPNDVCSDCHGATHAGTGLAAHNLGDATCSGGNCHADVDDVGLLHADADAGGGVTSCNVCHTSADTSLSSITGCSGAGGCHSNHDLSKHVTSASSECVDCHGSDDVRTVHPGGCSTCHGNATYPTLPGTNTAECTQCHGDEVGAGAYSPVDPNHYSSALHTSSSQGAQTYSLNGQTNQCQACHGMELEPEHSLVTSAMGGTGTLCVKCHTQTNAQNVVANNWISDECGACHGMGSIPAEHANVGNHTASSAGCSLSGAGCHNSNDLSMVGVDKSTNIHDTCLRCHDKTSTAPNLAYNPTAKTCGTSRACHSAAGQYDTTTFIHNGAGGLANGDDAAHHTADSSMNSAVGAYANDNTCSTCHSSTLGSAHATAGFTGALCDDCHNATSPISGATAVKSSWASRDCVECHNTSATYHNTYDTNTPGTHTATLGTAGADNCDSGGCHGTADVRSLHDTAATGCANTACHAQDKDMAAVAMSCGQGSGGCHTDKTNSNHGPDHDYTSASAYVDGSGEGVETGCAASGAGCHDSATSGDAVTTFHTQGAIDCLSSQCHVSPTMDAGWKSSNTGAECSACHDGTFTNAVDAIGLSVATPAGHYSTALHTATSGLGTLSAGGSASAGCSACHELSLKDAHQGPGFQSKTKGTKVTCAECHGYNAALTAEVKTLSWQNNRCTDCHNTTDMGAGQAMHSATTAPAVVGSPAAGCNAPGAGCHTSTDLHVLHNNASGCALSGCHDAVDKDMSSAEKRCGQSSGCHVSGTYSSSNHSGQTGDDSPVHAATGDSSSSIGGYTQTTACSSCHTLTLTTAHTTRDGWTSPYCLNCHNAASPINSVSVIKTTGWTTKRCNQCHSTYHNDYTAAQHTSTAGSGCSIGSCHGASGGAVDVRGLHDSATAGCSASGTDENGWSGACHQMDTQMTTTAMSCGTGATGLACHTGHTHTNHGGSSGGQACDACHTALSGMVNDTSTYHHVLDAADPFVAPGTNDYPTSTTSMACVSCHLDHDDYDPLPGGSGKAYSLRDSISNSTPVPSNTDDTLCLSCHNQNLARNTTGQKANTIQETMVWDVNPTYWVDSPHNYDSPGPFNDGSVFYANCAKCHGNLQGTLSSGKFSVHMSSEQRLLNALGDTTVYSINEEQMCFRCHSLASDFADNGGTMLGTPKPSDNVDWYGTEAMGTANVVIYEQMHAGTNTFGHKPHVYANIHLLDEVDETQAYISANKHVECADCHNHHAVGNARHEWGTTNEVSPALVGVTGVGFQPSLIADSPIANPTLADDNWADPQYGAELQWKSEAEYEYEICFKCHSDANSNIASWGGKKFDNTGVNNWTNVAQDFNVGNQSRHPVIAPLDAYPDNVSYGTSKVFAGQLIGIWAPGDTMYCSDCHGDSTAPAYDDVAGQLLHAQGPHGSSVRYSLRGPRTDWPTRSDTGQLITFDMVVAGYDGLFCLNCHPNVVSNKVHSGGQGNHGGAACIRCHTLIPHGSGMSRLMGDSDTMPARFAYQGNRSNNYIRSFNKKADPLTYARGDCSVTSSASGCTSKHSTSALTAPGTNW